MNGFDLTELKKTKIDINQYQFIKLLGSGAFGKVLLSYDPRNNQF